MNGLDPEACLAGVIDRVAKGDAIGRLSELLPRNWKIEPDRLAA